MQFDKEAVSDQQSAKEKKEDTGKSAGAHTKPSDNRNSLSGRS
jgi:hypothetical protein